MKLGKGISQLLPYALRSSEYKREGGRGIERLYLLCLSLTSLSFKVRRHPSLLTLMPLSPYLSHPSPPPPSLCSIFSVLLNYLMLPPFLLSFLPPPLNSSPRRYPSSFPSILISSPLPPLERIPPSPPCASSSSPRPPTLPRLQQRRAFSISAPLLQINDLICRNKQVSSTLSRVHFPPPLLTLQQHASERVQGREGE